MNIVSGTQCAINNMVCFPDNVNASHSASCEALWIMFALHLALVVLDLAMVDMCEQQEDTAHEI